MKFSPAIKLAAAGSIVALALTGCSEAESGSSEGSGKLSGELIGAGASSQGSAQSAWVAGFQTANEQVTVNYDPAGSGNGREVFQHGASSYAGSDRAFKPEEIQSGPFESCAPDTDLVEFPAYISPIAVVFNLDGVDTLKLDSETIAKIFSGKITKWNDSAITSQNPGVSLPDAEIKPVHRSDKSGTTGNFTEYLEAAAKDAWGAGAVEEWPTEFGGEGAQGTSGLVDAVKNGTNTIGYADASRSAGLGTVEVKVGDNYVAYSPESAAAVVDESPLAEGRADTDLVIELARDTAAEGVYPIVLVSYLVGCSEYKDAGKGELVKAYFDYIVSEEGQQTAAEAAGSAPLSATLRDKVSAIIAKIK